MKLLYKGLSKLMIWVAVAFAVIAAVSVVIVAALEAGSEYLGVKAK